MLAATPRVGTERQHDLESLPFPPRTILQVVRKSYTSFTDDPVYYLVMWSLWSTVFLIIAGAGAAFKVLVCFTGRHILDHYHLWHRPLAPDASSMPLRSTDGYLIAAAISGVLSTMLVVITFMCLDWLSDRRLSPKLRLVEKFVAAWNGNWVWGGGLIACLWIPVAPAAAMVKPRFEYVTPQALLVMYGMGFPIITPALIGGIYVGYYTIPAWRRWWDKT
ncbi:hypothetical protein DL96DRAFT_505448 [Flagelloscypha sp. PMI_526]|nr:hypothetical protein DL96DRAFT_505448 [Flagelloscypha sp. PMI_526]